MTHGGNVFHILGDIVAGAAGSIVMCMLYGMRDAFVIRLGCLIIGVGAIVWSVGLTLELMKALLEREAKVNVTNTVGLRCLAA